ncbi:MAG: hypothetical protein JXB03_01725 [Spirochaetales bacterium]|nr:hypothetical protein [Spirochaetales bacterium]
MKKTHIAIICGALLVILGGCASLSGIADSAGGFNPLGAVQAKAEKRVNAEIASGVGLTGLERKMMFNMMYSQVYFVGGFAPAHYDLEEGQGMVWSLVSKGDEGEEGQMETERALLKTLDDGSSWWYLSWSSDDAEDPAQWEFEALMDADMQAVKLRYYNADVGRIEETEFAPSAEAESEEDGTMEEPEEVPSSDLETDDLSSLSRGREKVKVGAGTFNAEKLVWEITDEETGEKVVYIWWVDSSVPGGLVRYEYSAEGSSITGELSSLKKGYTTKFSSY